MNKKVVYTAIYGKKDTLKNPLFINNDFDYICFTDNKEVKSDIWQVVYRASAHKDPVRGAKIFKVKPHEFLKEYDISLWIDANFLIKKDINSFLKKVDFLKNANMLLFEHDQGRQCIYDEAKMVVLDNKDNPEIVRKQMEKYKKEEYPKNNGLCANSILLRKHNSDDIINLSNMWWDEIRNFSRRDQLSFYYCKWKLSTKSYLLKYPNVDIRNNYWFQWLPHNYELQRW